MGFLTGTILFFFVLICFFLIGLVLLQSGKGNSVNIMGGGGQSTFGPSTADVLTKVTRIIAFSFIIFSLLLSFLFAKKDEKLPVVEEEIQMIKNPPEEADKKDTPPSDSKPEETKTAP
ncbi:MAG: preprotein translocase subunit SecG [Leptospiraceae bacterium]|nr:preprotein translocase subunit SecG [Leptospiraceae bacterium]MCP5511524.1 preprotein translocase subunit SecG [Leptospiraceae bacterium]